MKALEDTAVVARFPVSVNQQRCLVMEQVSPGTKGLNLAIRWEIRGQIHDDLIEEAFRRITDRHEILRSRFAGLEQDPVQEVMAGIAFRLDRFDIRATPAPDQDTRIRAIAVDHAAERFDLTVAGLMRVALVRTAQDRATLLIAVHNSVFDGFSIGILGDEFGTILAALIAGDRPDLPPLPLQYGDYALWQQDLDQSGTLAAEADLWTAHLQDIPYFELPGDQPRGRSVPVSASVSRDLPPDFDARSAAAARRHEVSVFALGTAAVTAALARFSGRRDVTYAIQIAGRDESDLERLIGIFTNPLVLRFDVPDGTTLQDQITHTKAELAFAMEHAILPFDRLVARINPPRDPLRIPLVSIMFNLQRVFLREKDYGAFALVSVPSHSPGTLYDLNINVIGRNSGWRIVMDYNAALFSAETAGALADLYVSALQAVLDTPGLRIADLPGRPDPVASPPDTLPAPGPAPAAPVAVPQDHLDRLARIWAAVLVRAEADIRGNFFDLGGYSVLALRMLSRVQQEFGARPSLAQFLEDPSFDGLAAYLTQGRAAPAPNPIWQLIEFRRLTAPAPVLVTLNQTFLFQSVTRGIQTGATLANLAIPCADSLSRATEAGFEAAMQAAAAQIRSSYGDRPVLLFGLCVDGRLALRIAQALVQAGGPAPLVAMIDTWAPGAAQSVGVWHRRWHGLRLRLARLRHFTRARLRGELSGADYLRQFRLTRPLLAVFGRHAPAPEMERHVAAVVTAMVAQTRGYRFAPYDGPALLFVTEEQARLNAGGRLGWDRVLAADTPVFTVPGWHGDALSRTGYDGIMRVVDARLSRMTAAAPQAG